MNKITRNRNFNKLDLYKSNPDYKRIKKVYLNNEKFSIASARVLLRMVKYNKDGKMNKLSINSKIKLDQQLKKYEHIIKKGQTVNQMNKEINKALKKSDKKNKLLNKEQIDVLLKNLNPTHKYVLKFKTGKETKYYTINSETKGFAKALVEDGYYTTQSLAGWGSDAYYETNYHDVREIEIIDITDEFIDDDNNTMNRNVGKFKSYNIHPDVDLSKYQIYTKDQKINKQNCLIYSLKKAGISDDLINNIIIKFSTIINKPDTNTDICSKTFEYIKREKFNEICSIIGRKITVAIQNSNGKNKKGKVDKKIIYTEYGKDINDNCPIVLAIYDNHIFNYEETIYKKYSIEHYDDLIISKVNSKYKWYEFGSKDKTTIGDKLTSLDVVILLDNLNKFEKIPYEIDLNDDVEIFTSNELLNNIELDQQLFQYSEKDTKPQNIFFGDLENINHTEKLSVPFLSGIIHKDDIKPQIYDGDECIEKMLNYVVSKSKKGSENIVYFHNMKYDFSLMKSKVIVTNIIEKDNQFYSVDLIYRNTKITLRDSYKVFNNKLEKFGTAFNLSKDIRKKEAIAYDYYNEQTIYEESALKSDYIKYLKKSDIETFEENVKPFMIPSLDKKQNSDMFFDHIKYYKHYLTYDCLVLQKGMIAYNDCMMKTFGKPIFDFLTISSYADDYFKTKGVYDETYEVKGGLKKFLSKAVYGGRVNVCEKYKKQIINKRINDFDGVSLYPSAIYRLCKEFGLVKGKAKRYNKNIVLENVNYYVVEIEITQINKKQMNPFIAYKTKESIKYINEIPKSGVIVVIDRFTLEDYIKFHEIEYNIIDGVYWNEGFNKKFIVIEDVFKERLKQKSLKTAEGDIKQELYKLILNSAYGKTLLKSSCEKDVVVNKENFNKYLYNNFNTIKHAKKLSDNQYLITQYSPDDSYNRAHCGIAILSMSKRIMNEVMGVANDENINIYYQDTDSMHIDDDQIQNLADKYKEIYEKELIGKDLGQFHSDFSHKNKACKDVVATKSIFLGKKVYIDYLEGTMPDGTKDYCIHARMKGINEISLYNKANTYKGKTIYDKVFQVYKELSEDRSLEFILNPDEKPSFVFTSEGVKKRESNKFKRVVSFQNKDINDLSNLFK
jgi:hypothetical protein